MKVLVVSENEELRRFTALTARGVAGVVGESVEVLEAKDGLDGITLAWRHMPQVVIADEITSRAGAFALARDLKGAATSHPAGIIILLERPQDAWLASWSGADGWFVKPVNPFELSDSIAALARPARREAV